MLPTAKNIYSNYTFWNMENNYRMSSGTPLDSLWGESELKFCWSFNPHKVLLSLDDHSGNLGLLESMSFHNQFFVQFSCSFMANFCNPMDCSMTCLPVNHQLLELTQTQVYWVCLNSWSWWWTGRPGVLQFMGSQRVGHDWATDLNWTESSIE